jgi:L-threonylcarbamoyladenylate synthase
MEVLQLTPDNSDALAARAAVVLRAGGVVLYPTDTLYGLGADALSDEAVDLIYKIKGRDEGKPVHALVSDTDMAEDLAEIPDAVRTLDARLPRGKVTFICKKRSVEKGIARGVQTFGFRIPDSEFCLAMVRAFGGPVTATSANVSGAPSCRRVEEILAQLGSATKSIALVVDAGELPERKASTVVDFSTDTPKVLRESAVSAAEIETAMRG